MNIRDSRVPQTADFEPHAGARRMLHRLAGRGGGRGHRRRAL